jgi:hypothetical protein
MKGKSMTFQKQYLRHLEQAWRITYAGETYEDGERILNLSFTIGEGCTVHDRFILGKDNERFAEFEQAVGDYGSYSELLDRRVGIVFDDRFQRRIVGYAPSFSPLAHG